MQIRRGKLTALSLRHNIVILLVLCLLITACSGAPAAALEPTPTSPSLSTQAITLTPSAPAAAPSATPYASPTALVTAAVTASAAPLATSAPSATVIPPEVNAASLPDPIAFQWKAVANGLVHPNGIANAGDGSGRLFIIEQPGDVRIIKAGQLLPAPFLDIRDRVGSNGSERGLLGIAFHPKFQTNGYFYVDYTDQNGDTTLSRFKISADPDQADSASEKVLLHIKQPFPNHNGGNVIFGPDGYLYIGMGDGGSGGDPYGNGQSLDTLLGKLLRIDVDHGDPYAIPADNPLVNGGGKPEIYAYGLRNPWRFEFDASSGDLYIADVGQNKYEEIDFLPANTHTLTNFGWNIREGRHTYSGAAYSGQIPLTDPVFEYDHSQGCSVTGGYVYRGSALPEFKGVYLFGDYCSGRVWGLLNSGGAWQGKQLFSTTFNISTFGVDEVGELYLADYSGSILRLERK
jgi:glucose/arabinose dehydrogenase